MLRQAVLSRHRLPHPYRVALSILAITPAVLLASALVISRGAALLDIRIVIPLMVMSAPALYYWHEGIDVLQQGLVTRQFLTRFCAYDEIAAWDYDTFSNPRVLTLWQTRQHKLAEFQASHLTNLTALLDALQDHIRTPHSVKHLSDPDN